MMGLKRQEMVVPYFKISQRFPGTTEKNYGRWALVSRIE
jgi:hypothetical protein